MIIATYRLKKDLPQLKKGAIFEHREWDKTHPELGNIGCGSLILAWINGSCQDSWAGGAYCFPGQLTKNTEWFELVNDYSESCVRINTISTDELEELINEKLAPIEEKVLEISKLINDLKFVKK